MSSGVPASDSEFLDALRASVDAYFAAIDSWEAAYRRFYRMPGMPPSSHPDLAAELRDVERTRREFESLLPRARRLCLKHEVRENFSALLRLNLGQYAPQERTDSAIGRAVRNASTESLIELKSAVQDWSAASREAGERQRKDAPARDSLLKRLIGFFY